MSVEMKIKKKLFYFMAFIVLSCLLSVRINKVSALADENENIEVISAKSDNSDVTNSLKASFYQGDSEIKSTDNMLYVRGDVSAVIMKNTITEDEEEIIDKVKASLLEEYPDRKITYTFDDYVGVSKNIGNAFSEYTELTDGRITISQNGLLKQDRQIIIFKKIASYKFRFEDENTSDGDNESLGAEAAYDGSNNAENSVDFEDDGVIKLVDITSYSSPYQIIFDSEEPVIKLADSDDLSLNQNSGNIATLIITDNVGLKELSFFRNNSLIESVNLEGDKRIIRYEYDVALIKDSDGHDEIRTVAKDLAGNISENVFPYYVDSSAPIISCSGIESGLVYGDSVRLKIRAEDNADGLNIYYKVNFTDISCVSRCIESTTKGFAKTGEISREYSEEGIYDLVMFAYDANGNYSKTLSYSFGIDTRAPELYFDNVSPGSLYNLPISVSARVNELFYENMNVEYKGTIEDASGIRNLMMSSYDVKSKTNNNIVTFSNEGKYNLFLKATDTAGHSNEILCDFTIDSSAPDIEISVNGDRVESGGDCGVAEVLNKIPDIKINTKDLYSEYAVIASVYNKEKDGSFKLNSTSNFMSVGRALSFDSEIPGEGEYMIKVIAKDMAGNMSEKMISLLIDENPPVIGYVSSFNEKYLKGFLLPQDLRDYIQDATNVRYKAYLNSKEVKSCDVKKDGKYLLQIVAEDEAGNRSEEVTAFIVDNTKPKIIVNGLDDDGKIVRNGTIGITLFDEEDFFKEAFVNGKKVNISESGKEILIKASEYGDYDISVVASDYAGNVVTQSVKTTCALSANPFTIKIDSNDIKTLTKNDEEIHETFFDKLEGLGFSLFCGFLLSGAVIVLAFALFDIGRLKG